jgi:hypothetical protein
MAYVKDKWWHTDSQGRDIGWLWPEDFVSILESFYGRRKWVHSFCYEFGFSRAQVDRWAKGKAPIPKYVAVAVSMMATLKLHKLSMGDLEASWLPDVEGANAKLGPAIPIPTDTPDPVMSEKAKKRFAKT